MKRRYSWARVFQVFCFANSTRAATWDAESAVAARSFATMSAGVSATATKSPNESVSATGVVTTGLPRARYS